MNTRDLQNPDIAYKAVHAWLMESGIGPDEAMDLPNVIVIVTDILGRKSSPTAEECVRVALRRIWREGFVAHGLTTPRI